MNTAEFLSHLRSLDVRLSAKGERLRIRAPKGALTPDLHSELTKRKPEILELLQETGGSLQTAFLSQLEGTLDLEAPVILPVTRDRPLPLSFVQERLWILDQLVPGNTTYNLGGALAIEGPLDVKALEDSLSEIVRRHEILRTSFSADDGIPQQVIGPAASFQLPCIMLNDVPEEKREQKIQELINREARRPFDLARGPLFRACLLCVDKDSHVLLLNMHHIVTDGWSMGVLFKELSVIYDAKVTKTEVSLPPLPIQYADYAVWQRGWLTGKTLAKQLSYWKQQLEGAPAVLELPHDRPRPALQNFVGGRLSLSLSDSLGKALRSLSSREGATLFMILLSAFKVLLYRYTGQEDVVVGSPIAGRNRKETEGLIGFFINNLVLRTSLSGNPTFRQLLARVRTVALDAYTHQDVPFEKLVEELRPERDLSRTPFFQVFFNTFNLDGGEPRLPGLRLKRLERSEAQSKFDLTIYARAEGDNIHFTVVYNADLFRADRINEMLAQLESLLTEAVRNPDRRIADFSLVTGRAGKRLPDPTQPLNADWEGAVHTHFSLQAQTFPQRLAVIDKWGVWTYKDLDSRSNQLANYLRHSGIEPHDIVAIYGHRSASLVLAVLGILKAGAALVILDPAYPATRLIDCLQAAKPRGWLHVEAAGAVPDLVEEFIESSPLRCRLELSRDSAAISHDSLCGYSTADPGVVVGPDDLAYVAFTSGSTGRPKGILGRHGSLSHFLPWQEETFDLGAPDRFSMLSGLSHDPLQRDLFTPLWLGATICIPDPEIIGTAKLAEWMAKEEITFAHLTPPMAELLTETAAPDCRIPSLRYAFFVGDKLTQRDVVRLRSLASGVTCINSYGSTETQRAVGCYVVPQSSDSEQSRDKSVYPLGRGMKDVQLLVLTAEQRLAGVGELGEIHVRSPHLALGYLGDEALTRMRFLTNPFTGVSGDRLYKTGDLGRYLPDGNVEFAGRVDRQVKIRGFRIEPEEVEAVLGQQPSIQQALVLVREDVPDQKRLVAYLIARAEALTPSELRNFVKSKLPDYMVPSAFVYLDSLPLTPNGKVDTEALPAADHHRPELEEVYVAPRSPVEQMLAEIWAGLLKLEQVGVHDNFFDLGGHSLLAAQLISRIRESFQIELPLRTLFERPSVAEIAKRVEEAHGEDQKLSTRPIVPVSRDKDLPLSFSQERLWFLDQYKPNSSAYNIPSALRLRGSLDVAVLERSLNEIVSRHESLRTTFLMVDGQPVQVIAQSLGRSLPVVDLRDHPEGEREEQTLSLISEEAGRPFDLAQGPPFRSKLLRLDEDDHVLLLTMHHVVSDGWSLGVLYRELSVLYPAFVKGEPSPLPGLPIQYADFAIWQREWLQGEVLDRRLLYWKKQLKGIPEVVNLPTDRPRTEVQSRRGARQPFVLSKDLTAQLKALSRKEDVTLYMTLLAGFKALLYQYTGQTDLVIASPIAGRNRPETEGLIGFFVNTLVLRSNLSGNPGFRELLKQVREVCLGAYAHQELPYQKLVEALHPKRRTNRGSLAHVFFAFQNVPRQPLTIPDLTVTPVRTNLVDAKGALTLFMWEAEECLAGSLKYAADLFNAATISRMIENFETLLNAVVADPELRLFDLPVLLEHSRSELLEAIHCAAEQSWSFDGDASAGHEQGEI